MDNAAIAVLVALMAILGLGTAYLIRKHGGFRNALYGGPVELVGEVAAGTLKHGSSEFRVSRVVRSGRPNLVVFRIYKSDYEGVSLTTLAMSNDQARTLSSYLAEAAGDA